MSAARFVVAQKKAIKLDVQAASIEVGTHAACALVLADAIAAPRHCAFVANPDGSFAVRDLGSDTGTYQNGLRVMGDAPLADGDEVIVGTTRLRVAVEKASEPTLRLQLLPQDLAFVAPRSGEFQSDPDRWARGEADLAKWPALRHANRWAARVLIVGLPLLLLWPRAREAFTDPGPLSRGHAALFTAAGAERFPREAKLAQEQGCAVCHDTLHGTPDSRCAQCHAGLAQDQHPFASTTSDARIVTGALAVDSCAECHQEHHGLDLQKPTPEQTPELCKKCHGGTDVAARGFTTTRAPAKVELQPKAYGGYRFAHQDHAAVDCAHCHRQAPGEALSARAGEFADVTFATCAGCHRAGATDPSVRPEWQPKADHVWTITWHGSQKVADDPSSREGVDTCGQCHGKGDGAGGFGPQLRQTTRPATDADAYAKLRARYAVVPRTHHEFLQSSDRDCARCHRDGSRQASDTAVRPFWHELHSSTPLSGLSDRDAQRRASTECSACHDGLQKASALVDASKARYDCATDATCGTCHLEGKRGDPAAKPLVPQANGTAPIPTRDGNDFPHDKHLAFDQHASLAAGCFTCHTFTPSSSDGPFAVPSTTPEAMSCLPCHAQHDHIAGGACRNCHGTGSKGAYNDFLGKRPPPDRVQPPRAWPTASAFDHFSKGHKESTQKDCAACHQDQSDVNALASLGALVAPTEADAKCRDCHLRDRKRFHWR